MPKPNAFDKVFGEPFHFTNDKIYVDRRHFTREQAAEMISSQCDAVEPGDLKEAFVRFGFPSMEISGYHEIDPPCWYGPVPEGRGAMPVWECG